MTVGLQLPSELVEVLGWIGMTWPEADEEQLFQLGQTWLELAGTVQQAVQHGNAAAAQVWSDNTGAEIEAFHEYWSGQGPSGALQLAHTAAMILGGGLIVYAAVVLALKVNFIAQLVILAVEVAQAIATAGPTFGASLLEVPIFQQITRAILENLLWRAIGEILGG